MTKRVEGHSRSLKGVNEQKKNKLRRQTAISEPSRQHALKLLARISMRDVRNLR